MSETRETYTKTDGAFELDSNVTLNSSTIVTRTAEGACKQGFLNQAMDAEGFVVGRIEFRPDSDEEEFEPLPPEAGLTFEADEVKPLSQDVPLTPTRAALQAQKAQTGLNQTAVFELLTKMRTTAKLGYFIEKTAKIPDEPGLRDMGLYVEALLPEELEETQEAFYKWAENIYDPENSNELIDGFADVAFLAIAGMYQVFRAQGHCPEHAEQMTDDFFSRVCDANNRKYPFEKNKVGKVIKPEGWFPPDTLEIAGMAHTYRETSKFEDECAILRKPAPGKK